MTAPQPHILEFDDFRIDAGKRLLLRKGESVPLTPKVFDTLLYLVENRGKVIEKDDLMGAIWCDTTAPAEGPSRVTLAVLPFENLSADPEREPVVPATHSRGMV
jgi:DNA-binding response OmpR family regulator